MPPDHDLAICVRHSEWSETSQVVTLLTRTQGLVRGLAKGSQRERSRFSGGFELLCVGELTVYHKQRTELATLAGWDLLETNAHLRRDLPSLWRAMYAIDLTQRALPLREPHPASFDALRSLLADRTPLGMPHLAAYQWQLLDEAGLRPELRREVGGKSDLPSIRDVPVVYFVPRQGGFAASPAGASADEAWPVRGATLGVLRELAGGSSENRPHSIASWERACRLLAAYWRWLLGQPIPAWESVSGKIGEQRKLANFGRGG